MPLELDEIVIPEPKNKEIRVKIRSCGICHTDLDIIEGRLQSLLPVIPGHQVIGNVEKLGSGSSKFKTGDRVGIAWIFSACRTSLKGGLRT